jgi:hypothetical protein
MIVFGKPISAYGMYLGLFVMGSWLVYNGVITLMPHAAQNVGDYIVFGIIILISMIVGIIISRFVTRIVLTVGPPIITALLFALTFRAINDLIGLIKNPAIRVGILLAGGVVGLILGIILRLHLLCLYSSWIGAYIAVVMGVDGFYIN